MNITFMLLNLCKVEVDGDYLFTEISYLNEVSPFIKEELEPSVSGPSHSENKESVQKHNISHILYEFSNHPNVFKPDHHQMLSWSECSVLYKAFGVMKVEIVNAELLVHFNYNLKCN